MRGMSSKRWTLVAAVLGSGIVFLDSTVVNVALPQIGRDLPRLFVAQLEGQSYVYNAYLLSLSALLILAGGLTDYVGRKRMFLIGLLGFGATSALCGFAPDMELLILFRILQGAAGALLVPGSLALLTATFSGEEQGRAFGLWAGASGATTLLGPVVGGVLVQTISWRLAFFVNVPLVAIAAYATWRYVQESRNEQASGRFDWLGAIDVGLAVGGLSFGLIYGGERDWSDPLAFVFIGVGIAALVVFPFLMRRRPDPLVPLGLFRSRHFTVTNISTFLIYGALYVYFYYLALFTQGTLGYTAVAAGLVGLPGGILLTFFSPRFGTLAARLGPRRFMAAGPVVMALGLLWLARTPVDSVGWQLQPGDVGTWLPSSGYLIDLLPSVLLFGIGITMLVAPADDGPHALRADGQRGPGLGHQQRHLAGRAAARGGRHLRGHHGPLLRQPAEPPAGHGRGLRCATRSLRSTCRRRARPPPSRPPPTRPPPTRSTWPCSCARACCWSVRPSTPSASARSRPPAAEPDAPSGSAVAG